MHSDHSDLTSFDAIADHYLDPICIRLVEDEMAWFASPPTLQGVIERACLSRLEDNRLHGHQQRPFGVWPQAPIHAADRLRRVESNLAEAHTFDDLHEVIYTQLRKNVLGIGELACYDIARRIGMSLHPKLEPTEIYLHRGAKEGAKVLGIRSDRGRVPISDLPEGLQRLTPAQAEDALCIYRNALERIIHNEQGANKIIRRQNTRCAVPRRSLCLPQRVRRG
jgi:hypothetical protein